MDLADGSVDDPSLPACVVQKKRLIPDQLDDCSGSFLKQYLIATSINSTWTLILLHDPFEDIVTSGYLEDCHEFLGPVDELIDRNHRLQIEILHFPKVKAVINDDFLELVRSLLVLIKDVEDALECLQRIWSVARTGVTKNLIDSHLCFC